MGGMMNATKAKQAQRMTADREELAARIVRAQPRTG